MEANTSLHTGGLEQDDVEALVHSLSADTQAQFGMFGDFPGQVPLDGESAGASTVSLVPMSPYQGHADAASITAGFSLDFSDVPGLNVDGSLPTFSDEPFISPTDTSSAAAYSGISPTTSPTWPSLQQPVKRRSGTNASVAGKRLHEPVDETARMAAEEDKRRRNTAASARFRVKKKQREQELEQRTKDMVERVSELEKTVDRLQMENTWLKGLLTEKNSKARTESPVGDTQPKRSPAKKSEGIGTVSKRA